MESATACAYSPDGKTIAATFSSGLLAVFSATDGELLASVQASRAPDRDPSVPADGELFISRYSCIPFQYAYSCAFSPDGSMIAVACVEKALRLFDSQSCRPIAVCAGHGARVQRCAFSPDDRCVAAASSDGTITLWDTRNLPGEGTGQRRNKPIEAVLFSKKGNVVFVAQHDSLLTWSARTGKQTHPGHLLGPFDDLTALAMPIAGDGIVASTRHGKLAIVVLPKLKDGVELKLPSAPSQMSDDFGSLDVEEESSSPNAYKPKVLSPQLRDCCITPDGLLIIAVGGDRYAETGAIIAVVNAEDGNLRMVLDDDQGKLLTSCACSPDSKYIVCGCADHTLQFFSIGGERLRALHGHAGIVTDCAFSPYGRRILSSSLDGTIRLWDVKTGETCHIIEAHSRGVAACAFSPDGRWLLSAGLDRVLTLWSARTGKPLSSLTGRGALTSVAFGPDSLSVVAGEKGGAVHILRIERSRYACPAV
jgi:WD40 repeat protein